MKFIAGLVFATIVIASTTAESTKKLDSNGATFPVSKMGPAPVVVPGSTDLGPEVASSGSGPVVVPGSTDLGLEVASSGSGPAVVPGSTDLGPEVASSGSGPAVVPGSTDLGPEVASSGSGPVVVPGSTDLGLEVASSEISDLGPEVNPNTPGYKQGGVLSSSSGNSDSTCNQVCPDVNDPVCGSDGVTYSNSCELGISSCKNPMKKIAKKSDGRCSS